MKTSLRFLYVFFCLSFFTQSSCKKPYQNPDNPIYGTPGPAGGIIFYDKGYYSDNWRYLEAAPFDQTTTAVWGCSDMSVSAVKYVMDIGKGKVNTQAIVTAHTTAGGYAPPASCSTVTAYAAKYCDDFSMNGYDDWFLPSAAELDLMLTNLYLKGIGNFVSHTHYWTSTENGQDVTTVAYAWLPAFHTPLYPYTSQDGYYQYKNNPGCVRAIRAY